MTGSKRLLSVGLPLLLIVGAAVFLFSYNQEGFTGNRRESSQEAGHSLHLDAHRGCCDCFRHYCLPGRREKRRHQQFLQPGDRSRSDPGVPYFPLRRGAGAEGSCGHYRGRLIDNRNFMHCLIGRYKENGYKYTGIGNQNVGNCKEQRCRSIFRGCG